jgi:predicted RNA binding protein YcfA (HicA-like mRNA interferase family)
VPRKIRQLIKELKKAGFEQVSGAGKGSHRKFVQDRFPGAVTLSGKEGTDAKQYQEREVKNAIEKIKQ